MLKHRCGDEILFPWRNDHSESAASYGQVGNYTYLGASTIGKLHLRDARPRDDAYAIRQHGDWLAVGVSDGLGSRPKSRFGSCFAAESLTGYLLSGIPIKKTDSSNGSSYQVAERAEFKSTCPTCHQEYVAGVGTIKHYSTNLDLKPVLSSVEKWGLYRSELAFDLERHIKRAFVQSRRCLESYASMLGKDVTEFGCTLLGFLLNVKTGAAVCGQIGDGLILGLNDGKALVLNEAPSPQEVGATYTVTQKNWQDFLSVRHLRADKPETLTTIYLMTDGVADDTLYGPPPDILQRWATDVDREMRQFPVEQSANRLLDWLSSYKAKGSFDDRTLVVIFR